MHNKKFIIITVIFAALWLVFYVCWFWGTSLSPKTTDWGEFANYFGVVLTCISITLIYITYREQRSSNIVSRNEQHIKTMISTLGIMAEKNKKDIENNYERFCIHFKEPYLDFSAYEQSKCRKVCICYYSLIKEQISDEIERLFRYLQFCLRQILLEKMKSKEEKTAQIVEMSNLLPDSLKILFFCWILDNDQKHAEEYYRLGFFDLGEYGSSLLSDFLRMICTGRTSNSKENDEIKIIELDLLDRSCELFSTTYNRLFNKQ